MTARDRIRTLRAWLDTRPGDRFALYALALELRKDGDDDAALTVFDTLLALHPGSGAGHFQRGRLLLDRGDVEAARRGWDAALEILAPYEDAEATRSRSEIRAALADLEPS
jgi:tetratricopeptide (TPR) repeat protein